MDRHEKSRELSRVLFESVQAVAATHGITLPQRGTSDDVERAFAALAEKADYRRIMVTAGPQSSEPQITISSDWGDKFDRIMEVVELINEDDTALVLARIEGHGLVIYCIPGGE